MIGFWERDSLFASMKNFDGMEEEQVENNEDDGEELACTSQTIQTIDPYTKVEFSDPGMYLNKLRKKNILFIYILRDFIRF